MRSLLRFPAGLFATAFRPRLSLQLEVVALRHQLSIYQRTGRQPRIAPADRILWAGLGRAWSGWRNHLFFVKPGTVIAWQRRRFRDHWRRLSQACKPGRFAGYFCENSLLFPRLTGKWPPPETGSLQTACTASFILLFSNPETRLGAGSAGP